LWDRTPPGNVGATPEQLAGWVRTLGSADFKAREEATARLIDIGPSARDALAKADGQDREVVDRTARIRREWEKYAVADHRVGPSLDMKQRVPCLAAHPDGNHWAALVGDWPYPTVVLGDVTPEGPRELRRLSDEYGAHSLVFSADAKTLYVGNGNATISVWRVAD
jgi:hypothetical protein